MSKVQGSVYGKRPKLTPESVGHVPRLAVRVLSAGSFQRQHKPGTVYWISTVKPPDHILFLNGRDVRQLVLELGDDTDGWVDQQVVLELVNLRYEGRPYEKYAVAPAGEWADVLRPLEAPPPSAKRSAKRKPPRKPRKRSK